MYIYIYIYWCALPNGDALPTRGAHPNKGALPHGVNAMGAPLECTPPWRVLSPGLCTPTVCTNVGPQSVYCYIFLYISVYSYIYFCICLYMSIYF